MDSLVKKSFRILFGRASVSVLSILFTIYFAYELPKKIFALIVIYETAAALFMVFTDLGLSAKVTKEAPPLLRDKKQHEAIRSVIFPSTLLRMLSCVLFCLLLFTIAVFFNDALKKEFTTLDINHIIFMGCLGILFEGLSTATEPVFAVNQKFGANSFLDAGANLVEQIFALMLYLPFGMNHYFTGVFFAQFFIFLIRCFMIRDTLRQFDFRFLSFQLYKNILLNYFPFYLRRFFRMGFLQGEQLLVAALLPLEQLANFNLAKKTSKYLKRYIDAFAHPFIVKLSKTRDLGIRSEFMITFLKFTIPPPLILCVLSPWIMPLIGGDKYAGSWPILAIFYFSYVFYALSTMQLCVITIFGDNKDSLYADVTAGIIGFAATFFLILSLGETGLAWGQVISFLTLYLAGRIMSRRFKADPKDAQVDSH